MTAKKGYVNSVIELGERLIEAKESVGHGNWETFVKSFLGGMISSQSQAWKYMQIAENKALVLEYFKDENSINGITKAISDASPEQLKNDFKDVFDYRQICAQSTYLSLLTSQLIKQLTAPIP